MDFPSLSSFNCLKRAFNGQQGATVVTKISLVFLVYGKTLGCCFPNVPKLLPDKCRVFLGEIQPQRPLNA